MFGLINPSTHKKCVGLSNRKCEKMCILKSSKMQDSTLIYIAKYSLDSRITLLSICS